MLIIADNRLPLAVRERLTARDNRLVLLPPHPALPHPVASHPDMLLFFAPDAIYCSAGYQKIAARELTLISELLSLEIRILSAELGGQYPFDIPLNAAPVGTLLFCLPTHTAAELCTHAAYRAVPVRQGYAKCATLPVGDTALITEDPSIARAAHREGLAVLQVRQNAVRLSGYSTGFLGGAASFAPRGDSREILFCGSLDTHPDAQRIRAFCEAHGYEAVSLSNEPLYDVGTMFTFSTNISKGDQNDEG